MRKLLLLIYFLAFQQWVFAQISLVKAENNGFARFEPLNNLLIFNSGDHLWKSDGTAAGTVLLKSNIRFDANIARRQKVGNVIFFTLFTSTQL